jgi:hypothetical protein
LGQEKVRGQLSSVTHGDHDPAEDLHLFLWGINRDGLSCQGEREEKTKPVEAKKDSQ